MIFYRGREWGVQCAMGGTGAIVRGLEKLMREEGIKIQLGAEVDRIQVKSAATEAQHRAMYNMSNKGEPPPARWRSGVPHVDGVRLKQVGDMNADLVVANADAPHVWQNLIDPQYHT